MRVNAPVGPSRVVTVPSTPTRAPWVPRPAPAPAPGPSARPVPPAGLAGRRLHLSLAGDDSQDLFISLRLGVLLLLLLLLVVLLLEESRSAAQASIVPRDVGIRVALEPRSPERQLPLEELAEVGGNLIGECGGGAGVVLK